MPIRWKASAEYGLFGLVSLGLFGLAVWFGKPGEVSGLDDSLVFGLVSLGNTVWFG